MCAPMTPMQPGDVPFLGGKIEKIPKDPDRPSKILLVVDQFEEFRTSPQAATYVTALLRLAMPGDDRIRVVLTMRRDYLYICDSFPDLRERLQGGEPSVRYLLHRMSREGLHAAITRPSALAGVDEADRADLARAVLKDVGDAPGELALLQMALWRTWSEAQGRGTNLVGAYDRIGRVEGSLAQAAEEVFAHLPVEEQQRSETLFVRLIRPGEAGGVIRRVAHLAEFDTPTQALAATLAQEKHRRLQACHEDTVEIAHEQLATQWLRYQRWIANGPGDPEHRIPADPRGDDLRLLQQLIAEASRWQAAPSDAKARYLAMGVDLELYAQLANRRRAWLSDVEHRFVEASVALQEREENERETARQAEIKRQQELAEAAVKLADEQLQRARIAALGGAVDLVLAIIAIIAGYKFYTAQQRADDNARAARAELLAMQARRAEAQAYSSDVIELGGALAVEAMEMAGKAKRPVEADATEAATSALVGLPLMVLTHGAEVMSLAVLADGRLASGGYDGKIKLWPKDGTGEPVVLTHGAAVNW